MVEKERTTKLHGYWSNVNWKFVVNDEDYEPNEIVGQKVNLNICKEGECISEYLLWIKVGLLVENLQSNEKENDRGCMDLCYG